MRFSTMFPGAFAVVENVIERMSCSTTGKFTSERGIRKVIRPPSLLRSQVPILSFPSVST